jgi:hypothetical protein
MPGKKYIQGSIDGGIFLPDSYKKIKDKNNLHRPFSVRCLHKFGANKIYI